MTADDMPLKSHDPGEAGEIEPSDLPDFVSAALAEDAGLDLLLPHDLPTDVTLDPAERAALRGMLMEFLEAVHLPDRTVGVTRIEALLAGLKAPRTHPVTVEETGTPAPAFAVTDFDGYFRVNRIASDEPALSLVRGLLQTARANLSLFSRSDHFPPERVAQQIAGFTAYAHLLARSFDLGELS